MADYHQIVDQIRAFVQSSDQTRNGALEGLASTYAEACVEVNQRMGRCHRLLAAGAAVRGDPARRVGAEAARLSRGSRFPRAGRLGRIGADLRAGRRPRSSRSSRRSF